MTLTEFLLARIAEDEAMARLALGANEGWYLDAGEVWVLHDPDGESASGLIDGFPIWADGAGEHIARHDPARVLAECDAKRRVVGRFQFIDSVGPAVDHTRALDMQTGARAALRDSMCFLALPYADHPDYRQEWKP